MAKIYMPENSIRIYRALVNKNRVMPRTVEPRELENLIHTMAEELCGEHRCSGLLTYALRSWGSHCTVRGIPFTNYDKRPLGFILPRLTQIDGALIPPYDVVVLVLLLSNYLLKRNFEIMCTRYLKEGFLFAGKSCNLLAEQTLLDMYMDGIIKFMLALPYKQRTEPYSSLKDEELDESADDGEDEVADEDTQDEKAEPEATDTDVEDKPTDAPSKATECEVEAAPVRKTDEERLAEMANEIAKRAIAEEKEKIFAEARLEAEKIIDAARLDAAKIVDTAREDAERVRAEAEKNADVLMREAVVNSTEYTKKAKEYCLDMQRAAMARAEDALGERSATEQLLTGAQQLLRGVNETIMSATAEMNRESERAYSELIVLYELISDARTATLMREDFARNPDLEIFASNLEQFLSEIEIVLASFGIQTYRTAEGAAFDGKRHRASSGSFNPATARIGRSVKPGFKRGSVIKKHELVELYDEN